jgi:hypothetical protein
MSHETPGGAPSDGAHPLLGTPPSVRRSRFSGFTFGGERLWEVAGVLVLVVLGSVLPYLSMPYINRTVELVQEHASLFPAAQFIRGLDPLWLPGYQPGPTTNQIVVALNVFNLGSSLQQIGAVVAVLTCAALFQDEINKFFWWPLHLSGWVLALSPVPLWVGLNLLHRADVAVTLQAGWLPVALAGALALVATFRSRSRIDSYASI